MFDPSQLLEICYENLFIKFRTLMNQNLRAFDRVPSDLLMSKLEDCGLGPKIVRWTRDQLKNCTQQVIVGGKAVSTGLCTFQYFYT